MGVKIDPLKCTGCMACEMACGYHRDDALALLSACEKPQPPPPEPASAETAEDCYQRQDYACARANYAGYLKQYPNDTHAMAMLAFSLTRAGKHREALPYYQKVVAAGIGTYDLFANYALSLDATGDLDGAIKRNRQALEAVPNLVDVRGDLAQQLVRQGKRAEALELLQSFDRQLVKKGEIPYFTAQIAAIKEQSAGQ